MKLGVGCVALVVGVWGVGVGAWCPGGYPLHAQCTVDWTVGLPCSQVGPKLKAQMALWKDRTDCPNSGSNNQGKTLGEKCLYQFVSEASGRIDGHHFTPVENYRDTFYFTWKGVDGNPNACALHGHSSSDIWYAYLDLGTNYCNIFNLVDGSGMTATPGFSEKTTKCQCTQYDKRNCTIY